MSEDTMRICGISFESKAAAVAIIEFSTGSPASHIDTETRRISLNDHEDANCLRSFQQTVKAFLTDNSVNNIAIKRCIYSGKYRSGAAPLKMEALLQVLDFGTVLIPGQTISSNFKNDSEIPQTLRAYQHDAFRVAIVKNLQEIN